MARRFEHYQIKKGDNLGEPEFWNRILEDLDLRLAARELDGEAIANAVDQLISVGLGRINDTFTPVIEEAIERLRSVGAQFAAASTTPETIDDDQKTFVLTEGTRASYIVTDYVSIRPTEALDRAMIAQIVEYDRETGELEVLPVLVIGTGSYADWQVRPTPAPDIEHATRTDNPHATTAAQVGAYSIAGADAQFAPKASPLFTGTPAAPTASPGTNTTQIATTAFVRAAVTALINSSPSALDTLAELAAAIGNDTNFSVTVLDALATRLRFDGAQSLSSSEVAQLLANMTGSVWSTGDGKLTFKSAADAGWIMADDGTIGDAASGATTRANADTQALFTLLYNLPVTLGLQDSSGSTVARGANAAADYAAHRRLVVPKQLGRSIAIAGSGAGLTARSLGGTGGSETETPTQAKTAAHFHTLNLASMTSAPPDLSSTIVASGASSGAGIPGLQPTSSIGSGNPLNIVDPSAYWNVMIKL